MGNGSMRYECSRLYRWRWEHLPVDIGIGVGFMISTAAVPLFILILADRSSLNAVVAAEGWAWASCAIFGAAFVAWYMIMSWVDRSAGRARTAFLSRARAHGGWWYCIKQDRRARIARADAIEDALLLEPLDATNDAHRAAIQAEVDRLSGIIHECDRSVAQTRPLIAELRALLPATPTTA